ncbi:phospholipase A2 inhibitor and Ly6/PLAUR domain-containing protein-like [Podarcis muralis]
MQKALLSTCLLLALLSPVTSLVCSYCHNKTTSCKGESDEKCGANPICVSGVLDNNIVSQYEMTSYRGCGDSKHCHSGDYSLTSANGNYLQAKVFCCGTEKCNKEPLYVPPREDLSPNGLECPACFGITNVTSNPKCKNQGTVSCLGNETKCIDYSSRVSYFMMLYKKLKLKGCATEDVCALNGKNTKFGNLKLENIVTKCSDASEQIVLEG